MDVCCRRVEQFSPNFSNKKEGNYDLSNLVFQCRKLCNSFCACCHLIKNLQLITFFLLLILFYKITFDLLLFNKIRKIIFNLTNNETKFVLDLNWAIIIAWYFRISFYCFFTHYFKMVEHSHCVDFCILFTVMCYIFLCTNWVIFVFLYFFGKFTR